MPMVIASDGHPGNKTARVNRFNSRALKVQLERSLAISVSAPLPMTSMKCTAYSRLTPCTQSKMQQLMQKLVECQVLPFQMSTLHKYLKGAHVAAMPCVCLNLCVFSRSVFETFVTTSCTEESSYKFTKMKPVSEPAIQNLPQKLQHQQRRKLKELALRLVRPFCFRKFTVRRKEHMFTRLFHTQALNSDKQLCLNL